MKVLVTGGAGFIGSHLSESLVELGHDVVALDDLSTGSSDNLQHLANNPRFRFVEGTLLDEASLGILISEADLIFHLAAAVGVTLVIGNLVGTLESNVRGTENVIRLAHQGGGKKVVLASTSEVYGKSPEVPWREDSDLALGPTSVGRWGYACSKILDEFLALAYHKEMSLPVVILRLFNTVGPRQSARYGMVIPRFVSQALKDEPITVYGDGTQTRCFSYVGDVIAAMIAISQIPSAEGQVFNVGNDHEVTMHQLASLVQKTLKSKSPIVHIPYTEAYGPDFEDISRRLPDVSKLRKYIDFNPDTDLERIINEVAWDMAPAAEATQSNSNR